MLIEKYVTSALSPKFLSMKRTSLLIIALACSAFLLKAGGFQVGLQGQKQTGMGLIGTGLTLGPSTLFFNPGGLSFLAPKYGAELGISPLMSNVSFQKTLPSAYEASTDNPLGTPFAAYVTARMNEKLSLGVGVYTPFGSSTNWGEDWAGRFLIQDISLLSIFVQPTVSYKVNDKLGIGIGLVYAYGKVSLSRALPVLGQDGKEGRAELEGATNAWGFNAGISYRPVPKLELGLTYRSTVTMEMDEGEATFSVPLTLASNFPSPNTFSAKLPLPGSVNLGGSYKVNDKFLIGADIHYVFWHVYDSLIFDFEKNSSSLQDSRSPKLLKDNMIFRIGGQYTLNEKLNVRAGGYYDSPAVEDDYYSPETPDAVKIGLTLGLSWTPMPDLDVDVSFLYVMGLERDVTYSPAQFGGKYKYNAYIPGFGITYRIN